MPITLSRPPTMSSPESPYHVLRRLLSLCHNTPRETAHFYASLLHDLFADDLLAGIDLDVRYLDGDKVKVEKVGVDPHLAVHVKAWLHVGRGEYYPAIHLVRDRVFRDNPTNKKGKERKAQDHSGATTLPFDGTRHLLDGHPECLECAMIMAEACQSLGRFEEGRKILHHVHAATSRATGNPSTSHSRYGHHELTRSRPMHHPRQTHRIPHLVRPPSRTPLHPIKPRTIHQNPRIPLGRTSTRRHPVLRSRAEG